MKFKKSPNIKALIDLFNQKIEALLDILDAQRDMEEKKNFIEIVPVENTDAQNTENVATIDDTIKWKQYTDVLDQIQKVREGIKISWDRMIDRRQALEQAQTSNKNITFAQRSYDTAISDFNNTLVVLNST